jgi:hypothetical protein
VQAVDVGGSIDVLSGRTGAASGFLEIRDDGPGVSDETPAGYFQAVFHHAQRRRGIGFGGRATDCAGSRWEIACLPNQPHGAVFRIAHIPLAGRK